ncbi:hypothetical protein AMJ51_01370 [Microgenomates bacterium DG_75]|nr:MAG: hypothetical protein AMJ51_01370 [Microgenomates bacterium DG_75]
MNLITLYDNYQSDPNLETGHGFSCLAKSKDQTILFDTGADSLTLLSNMEKLGINPQEIDIIVLSHIHSDHVDGLWGLLEKNKDVKVYLPASFPDSFREKIKSYGANYQDVKSSIQIKEGIYSTGELGTFIKEQALVVKTEKGLVVLTGCAHPGVVSMVRKAKEVGGDKIHLVMGGFHLGGTPDSEIEEIIKDLKQLGVDKVAPCHCSGDRARQLFQIRFGENYFENGVGKEINL